jgi:hypothetical protein
MQTRRQKSHPFALVGSLATTTYNYAMASAEHTSEQARQGEDVRLVVDANPHARVVRSCGRLR